MGWLSRPLHRKSKFSQPRTEERPSTLGTFVTAYVAREAVGVLQARDAQMDERALEAPQEGAGEGGN
jgi:hypothetical protein